MSSPQRTKRCGLARFGASFLTIGIFIHILFGVGDTLHAQSDGSPGREQINLSGTGWQFMGAPEGGSLPGIDSDALKQSSWNDISIPHVFQTRAAFNDITKGWYRRSISVDSSMAGKELYLVFEGVAAIADVYVNGQHLGQHRGAYTRFVFDATSALRPGRDNQLAIQVDNSPESTADCLPSETRLYKVWGGLYRKVWLVAVSQVHLDPTDYASPGIYLTPKNVSANKADLNIRVLLRNTSASDVNAEVHARVLDPDGKEVTKLTAPTKITASGRATVSNFASRPRSKSSARVTSASVTDLDSMCAGRPLYSGS